MENIQKIKILLAEDDENLGTLLREYLIVKSYDADWFINGEKAYKSFIKFHYDLCILCLLYTSPSPRDGLLSRMPSSA